MIGDNVTTTTYKGFTVLTPEPPATAPGSQLIQNNFKLAADKLSASLQVTGVTPAPFALGTYQVVGRKDGNVVGIDFSELRSLASDTSPELGGDLNVNGHAIVSSNNGDVVLAPDGTGTVYVTSGIQTEIGLAVVNGENMLGFVYDPERNVFMLQGNLNLLIQSLGNKVGIGTTTVPSTLSVGGSFNLGTTVPGSATAAGTAKDLAVDGDYIHVCTTTGTSGNARWKKLPIAPPQNVVTVGSTGMFSSIAAAADSITDSTPENRYVIKVAPGDYHEPVINLPNNVCLLGDNISGVRIFPDAEDHHVVVLNNGSEMMNLTICGAGDGYAGIYSHDVGNFCLLHKVSIQNCRTGVLHTADSEDSYLFLEYVDLTDCFSSVRCVSENDNVASLVCENLYFEYDEVSPDTACVVDGDGAELVVLSSNCNGRELCGSAFSAVNGGHLIITSSRIRMFDKAVYIPDDDWTPFLKMSDVDFGQAHPNTMNIVIENNTAFGSFQGYSARDKISVILGSPFFVSGQDPKTITVAEKGGDFTSLKAAMDSITDSGYYNRYIIHMGPGIFVEDTITMKNYVSISGEETRSTVIVLKDDPTTPYLFDGALMENGQGSNFSIRKVMMQDPNRTSGGALFKYRGGAVRLHQCRFMECETAVDADGVNGAVDSEGNQQNTLSIIDCSTAKAYDGDLLFKFSNTDQGDIDLNVVVEGFTTLDTPGGVSNVARLGTAGEGTRGIHTTAAFLACAFQGDGEEAEPEENEEGVPATGNCIEVNDGVDMHVSGCAIKCFDKGIYAPNTGEAPEIEVVGTLLYGSTTYDVQVEHPSATGTLSVTAGKDYVSIASDNINVLLQDADAGSLTVAGDYHQGPNYSSATDLTDSIAKGSPLGRTKGGAVTELNGTWVRVSAGAGYILTEANTDSQRLLYVEWPQTEIELPANSSKRIYVDASGTVKTQTGTTNFLTDIFLARAITNADDIVMLMDAYRDAVVPDTKFDRLFRLYLGSIFSSGCLVTANGRTLNVTSGSYAFSTRIYSPSGGSPITFTQWAPSGSFYDISTPGTTVDNQIWYDETANDNAGAPAWLDEGAYVKHALYLYGEGSSERYFLVTGHRQFTGENALNDAINGEMPPTPTPLDTGVVLIAAVIIQKDATEIARVIDQRPTLVTRSNSITSASIHGNLSGLLNDDHPQYMLLTGGSSDRAKMTGNLDVGGHNIVDVGTVDGVDVSAHASRHLPNGSDPATTAAPLSNLSHTSSNGEGLQNSLARSDHSHAITAYSTNTEGLVKRDSSGNFAANVITATLSGNATNVTGIVAVANGGTNSSTALNNNRIMVSSGDKIVESAALGTSMALATNSSGIPVASSVTATELGYLSGITSAIQTQINSKQATITGAATTIASADLTASRALVSNGSGKVAVSSVTPAELECLSGVTENIQTQFNAFNDWITTVATVTPNRVYISDSSGSPSVSSVTTTELGYLSGVTSAVQTQINTKQATITGAATTIASSDLTTSRALVSNSSGKVAASAVTATELGYLSGVTSAVQTQLDAKQATITGAATTITSSDLTTSRALVSNGSGKVAVSAVTSSELGYLSGVTSNVQTQLDAKQAAVSLTASRAVASDGSGGLTSSSTTATELGYLSGVTSNVQTQIDAKQATISVAASRALASDGSGHVTASATTATELGYLSGVTGAIQTQLNSKQATISLTPSRAVASDGSGALEASAATATELGYLSGVTSAVQTQIDSKQATLTGAATTIASADLTASRALASNGSGKVAVSATTATELGYLSGVTSAIQTQLDAKAAASTVTNHTSSTSNPHQTTLEQARSQNNALSGDIDANSHTVVNLPDPVNPGDACNKRYADATASGLKVLPECKYATTTSLAATYGGGALTSTAHAVLSIDGSSPSVADRVLVKDQASQTDNGIYVVTNVGQADPGGHSWVLTRATDFDSSGEITNGSFVLITDGSTNKNSGWALTTTPPIVLDDPADGLLVFSKFSQAADITAGTGLDASFNVQVDGSTVTVVDNKLQANTITGVLAVAHGGTNSSTGLSNGRVMVSSGGAIVEAAAITASRALVSSASGLPTHSSVTSTELGYVSGVTSAIQTQIDSKQATLTGAVTSITSSDLTASRTLVSDSSGKVAVSAVTSTELGYLSGVTSAIQTQIDSKQATISLTASRVVVSDGSGHLSVSSVTPTELGYLSGATSAIQTQIDSKQATLTGAVTTIASSNLTASRAVVSDGSGKVTVSAVTSTELSYLSGVTGAIQTQIDAKQATITLTASKVVVSDGSGHLTTSATGATELGYLSGVTSALQTQIDSKQATITGAASTIASSNLAASKALTSDASGKVAVSAVTSTELGYLSGVTGALQTQIDAKQATITGAATTIASSNLTVSRALVSDGSGKVAVSAVTSTELGYVSGVTSAIQTQIDGKQATITGAATTIASSNLTASRALTSDASGKVAVSAVTDTELGYVSGVTSAIQTQINAKVPYTGATGSVDLGANSLTLTGITNDGNTYFHYKALTLANGTNNNVALPAGTFFIVSGPTNNFTITGFSGGTDGRYIILYNPTANNMTIADQSTNSTAGNRFFTSTAANISTTGRGSFTFVYSATESAWLQITPVAA